MNVAVPTVTPYLPEPSKATGAAMVVCPGGGYFMLSIDSEGHNVARWLAEHGIAAFGLESRFPLHFLKICLTASCKAYFFFTLSPTG